MDLWFDMKVEVWLTRKYLYRWTVDNNAVGDTGSALKFKVTYIQSQGI